jgi:predicted RNA-binding Zn ribbon-like protein
MYNVTQMIIDAVTHSTDSSRSTMRTTGHRGIEYPLLGEPPIVEFVNTLYVDRAGTFDFLSTVELARGWFAALEPPILSDVERVDDAVRHGFVELRSAVLAVIDSSDVTRFAAALAELESAANASPSSIKVTTDQSGLLTVDTIWDLADPAGTSALLAHAAIDVVAGRTAGPILVCDRPGCNMRYLQHHRRRRYCNPACANAHRQARFQQRNRNRDSR